MDKLEPLQRFDENYDADYAEDMIPFDDGAYVLYAAVQARERVLVDALRRAELDCRGYDALHDWLEDASAILAQYNAEQEEK